MDTAHMAEVNMFTNQNTKGILMKCEEIKKPIHDHMVH